MIIIKHHNARSDRRSRGTAGIAPETAPDNIVLPAMAVRENRDRTGTAASLPSRRDDLPDTRLKSLQRHGAHLLVTPVHGHPKPRPSLVIHAPEGGVDAYVEPVLRQTHKLRGDEPLTESAGYETHQLYGLAGLGVIVIVRAAQAGL